MKLDRVEYIVTVYASQVPDGEGDWKGDDYVEAVEQLNRFSACYPLSRVRLTIHEYYRPLQESVA